MQLITILGIAVAIAAVAFALQNNVPVTVTFLLWRFDSSLAMVLLLALAVGAIIVALVSTPRALRQQWLLSRQRSEIAALKATEAELEKKLSTVERQNKTGSSTRG
ncbi:MAG: LapA family protein [Betaproteobacteria bacterium]|nr:LapA family protein [Betaproteobacteria bacterium]MBI2293375.1 LapA family protein [Betaproteobacteria bacterium]